MLNLRGHRPCTKRTVEPWRELPVADQPAQKLHSSDIFPVQIYTTRSEQYIV